MKKILKTEFTALMKQASTHMGSFPWENRQAYAEWLAQTYFFVKHSSRLLALGAASAKQDETALHKRMVSHLKEEMGHEVVAANDLKNLGFNAEEMHESAITKAFYQNQYFMLQNKSAASFLGYILVLEGFAASEGPEIYRRVASTFGPKCTHFVKLHAEEDQEHIQKALGACEGLSEKDEQEVIENMLSSAELYFLMLDQIKSRVSATMTATSDVLQPQKPAAPTSQPLQS